MNIKNLNQKGKLLLLNEIKAQVEATMKLYKPNIKATMLESNLKTLEVEDVGHFTISKDTVKTVEQLIQDKKNDIAKLEKEIEELKQLDENMEITTSQGKLNCYTTDETKQVVNDLLKNLIENDLNSKALKNKASKISRI